MNIETYNIRQDGFKEIKRQILIRIIPIMPIVVTVGILISNINSKDRATDADVLPFAIPFIVAVVGFGLYKGVNRQKSLFDSYKLTISNNLITREQLNTPTISIYLNDIKEIIKHKNGGFTIKGKDTSDLIGIPSQIENYLNLQSRLEDIHPIIEKKHEPFFQKYQSLVGILTVGLMLCVYTVNNKIVVALSGTILVALMIWSFIIIRNNKNIDNKIKKSVWLIFVVLASVIGVMIIKLTGQLDL